MPESCFHCGEEVPANLNLTVEIDGIKQPMCCPGCEAVANEIVEFGLLDYYRHRTELADKPTSLIPEELEKLSVYDLPQVQSGFVKEIDHDTRQTDLIIEGINCPACTWLIETRLGRTEGIVDINVNYSTQRCHVQWNNNNTSLTAILSMILELGYQGTPYNHEQRESVFDKERKKQLLRIGIAGLFGMQVMMISIALYFGHYSGIDETYKRFFYWISLLLTLPVLLFSGKILFAGAWRDIMQRHPGMDIPIALGLSIAFIGSLWATAFNPDNHVYYDSIVMFIFFILGGRYFEFMSRKRSVSYLDKVTSSLPPYATRLTEDNKQETVAIQSLAINEHVLVKPGEVIPIDGNVIAGESTVDESILTGESLPEAKRPGSNVIGGSVNIESPLTLLVTKTGEQTFLSGIAELINKSGSCRTKSVMLADKLVSIFICAILLIAAAVAFYWYQTDPSQWLPITVAVLVVTCPCALSLAMPTAMSCAATTLMQRGIALINQDGLEKLNQCNCFVFDKTGTLTKGKLELKKVALHQPDLNETFVLGVAAQLEAASEHPIARAILKVVGSETQAMAEQIINYPGQGISGNIDQTKWYIGTRSFIEEHCKLKVGNTDEYDPTLRQIILAKDSQVVASLFFSDPLRENSQQLIDTLKSDDKDIILMSGDHQLAVEHCAVSLGIKDARAELKPDEKQQHIAALQCEGKRVCIVGDGINDAPAFAEADVAIAMTEASDLTKLNADLLLLNHNIGSMITLLNIGKRTNFTIKTNFAWAIAYNIVALPFAIAGFLAPWMAALGMSLSSLVVVLNATRLLTKESG